MRESVEWHSLEPSNVKSFMNQRVVAIRGDGRMYAGVATESSDVGLVLTNGHHQQALPFTAYKFHAAILKGPSVKIPKLAEKRLV